MLLHRAALVGARIIGRVRRKRSSSGARKILLTGRFDSDNWLRAHLRPLASSIGCRRLCVVSVRPIPGIPGVEPIYPPPWLIRFGGQTGARLLTFVWTALCEHPDMVGGFHLLINGLVAIALAPLIGAKSLYFCVGGPTEVIDGGVWSETDLFMRLETPDPVVERRLISAVSACDMVVTMGKRAVDFLLKKGANTNFHVVSGGIDAQEFRRGTSEASIDLIMVGRLEDVKRVDVLLNAMRYVARVITDLQVVVVGDGRCRTELEGLAMELGVRQLVRFVGYQHDVADWLRRSKVFVLTSDSEGLSLSMIEAMMCGLPVVVSSVGDLADLVEDGVNGYLVPRRSPKAFAERIVDLLQDEEKLATFSRAARRSALRYDVATVTRQWDEILADGR